MLKNNFPSQMTLSFVWKQYAIMFLKTINLIFGFNVFSINVLHDFFGEVLYQVSQKNVSLYAGLPSCKRTFFLGHPVYVI